MSTRDEDSADAVAHAAVTDDTHRVRMLVGRIAADSAGRGETDAQYAARLVAARDYLSSMIETRAERRSDSPDDRSPHAVAARDLAATSNVVGVLRVLQRAGYDQLSRTTPGAYTHTSIDWLVGEIHRARLS